MDIRVGEPGAFEIHADTGPIMSAPWSFDALISPLSTRQFFEHYWGRSPLRIARSNPEFYRDLISIGEIEQYLAIDEFFVRHSVTTPSRDTQEPVGPPSSGSELYERLRQGHSLRLRRMECFMHPCAPVLRLFRAMELALQHPKCSLSCYVSPPGAAGLGPHHDETEIFTLQVAGSKRWRLFHRVDTDVPGLHEENELGASTHDIVLEPGDLLYLPRGYVHLVTNEEPSFSLTIVFEPFQWRAVLDLLVDRLARTSAFVAPLPAGVLHGGARPDAFRRDFEDRIALVRDALAELTVGALVDALAPRHLQRMTLPPGNHLTSMFAAHDELTLGTWVERRDDVAAYLRVAGDHVVLVLPGGYTLQADSRAEEAFRRVLSSCGPFRVADIHESLSRSARLALGRKLIDCGVLRTIAAPPEPH